MYIQAQNPQGIFSVWNNSGSLIGDQISYITHKTMIQIPLFSPEIGKIINVTGQSRNLVVNTNYQWASGNLFFELDYEVMNSKNKEKLNFTIPYQGPVFFQTWGQVNSEVKFIHARLVGFRNILIEAVIALTQAFPTPWSRGGKDDCGEFYNKSSLLIESNFPQVQEVLATKVEFTISEQKLEDGLLTISGWRDTTLLYVADKTLGDKIILKKNVEPFREIIRLEKGIANLGRVAIVNKGLNTKLINPRELILEGRYSLRTAMAGKKTSVYEEMAKTVEKLKEMAKTKKQEENIKKTAESNETSEIENGFENISTVTIEVEEMKPVEIKIEEVSVLEKEELPEEVQVIPEEEVEIIKEEVLPIPTPKKEEIFRKSRRNLMSKHMRQLNDSFTGPSKIKTIKKFNNC